MTPAKPALIIPRRPGWHLTRWREEMDLGPWECCLIFEDPVDKKLKAFRAGYPQVFSLERIELWQEIDLPKD